jgi:predicted amidohydrolase
MSKTIQVAAIRLSNEPAPTEDRLRLAEAQIVAAAQQGAQLVVLPEVFNTGYIYSDETYTRAESMNGLTVTWMKRLAAEHHIHLAGALLVLGPEHITDSLILVAPDGRLWRYDKNHPWVWERAYFREGRDITVAQTDIGTFGLLICIDVLRPGMFQRYAGQVDALIISTSPPKPHQMSICFPDGTSVSLSDALGLMGWQLALSERVFGEQVRAFAASLGVSVIQSSARGQFSSPLAAPRLSLAVLMARQPSLWQYWLQAKDAVLKSDYYCETFVSDSKGNVLARHEADEDGFALASLDLTRSSPGGRHPMWSLQSSITNIMFEVLGWLMIPTYRRGIRRAWGRHMAPVDFQTKLWSVGVVLAALVGYGTGRKKRCK